MQRRMIDFIRALRAAGVRVSLAESQDAMFGVDETGVQDAATFKSTMKTTLVKNHRDQPIFDISWSRPFEGECEDRVVVEEESQKALEAAVDEIAAQYELMPR